MFPKPPRLPPPPRAIATQVVQRRGTLPQDRHVLVVPPGRQAPPTLAPHDSAVAPPVAE